MRRSGDGSGPWYHYRKDYVVAECVVLMCLLVAAIVFEFIHHRLVHGLKHIQYGVKKLYDQKSLGMAKLDPEEQKEEEKRKKLKKDIRGANKHYEKLMERTNSEFMVLGFLAFMVWVFNQSEAFYKIAKHLDDYPDYYSLLHLCENVHMFLFIAMCLNFCLCGILIHISMKWQIDFACLEHPDIENLAEGKETSLPAPMLPFFIREQDKWNHLKTYFIATLKGAGTEAHSPGNVSSPRNKDRDGDGIFDIEQTGDLDQRFDFGRYLSACLDQILNDVVTFSEATWFIVLVIFAIHCIFAAIIEYGSEHDSWVEIQLDVMVLIVVISSTSLSALGEKKLINFIHQASTDHYEVEENSGKGWFNTLPLEVYAARVQQGLMFIVCYAVSRMVASKDFWKGDYTGEEDDDGTGSQITLCLYVIVYFYCGMYLNPKQVIITTIWFALPPYVDEDNWSTIKAVIAFDHENPDHWKLQKEDCAKAAEANVGQGIAKVVPLDVGASGNEAARTAPA